MKPKEKEYAEFYARYVKLAPETSIAQALAQSEESIVSIFNSLTEDQGNFAYAEGKWNLKEMLVHLMDSERIFSYRALRIARNDLTPLAGFEQDDYVPFSNSSERRLSDLIEEYKIVRLSTKSLFNSFTSEMLERKGIASNSPISCRALAYIISGHELHHKSVIEERYLINAN
ncbi:MAG: DinB family protein [Bacteroidota bacterium]